MLHQLLHLLCSSRPNASVEEYCANAYLLGEAYTLVTVNAIDAGEGMSDALHRQLVYTYRQLALGQRGETQEQQMQRLLARRYIATGALTATPAFWSQETEQEIHNFVTENWSPYSGVLHNDSVATHLFLLLMLHTSYGGNENAHPWHEQLETLFDGWSAELSAGAAWVHLTEAEAIRRIATLNKHRYMLCSHRYDAILQLATEHYLSNISLPCVTQAQPLSVIERLALTYDTLRVLLDAHLYSEHRDTLARYFAEQYPLQPSGSQARHLCSTYTRLHTLLSYSQALQMAALSAW